MTARFGTAILLLLFMTTAYSAKIPCQRQAETFAISESKKNGKPADQLHTAQPTEMDGDSVVVYVGARTGYDYYKLKSTRKSLVYNGTIECRLLKYEMF